MKNYSVRWSFTTKFLVHFSKGGEINLIRSFLLEWMDLILVKPSKLKNLRLGLWCINFD